MDLPHPQDKELKKTPYLRHGRSSGPGLEGVFETDLPTFKRKDITSRYYMYGFHFLPLVREELHLLCGLNILFLRPEKPGSLIESGDIDNRIKTLLDSLRIPVPNEDYSSRAPSADQNPLYCLLANDKLITKISVETDQLLEPIMEEVPCEHDQPAIQKRKKKEFGLNDARLVITVQLRPYELHFGNMPFG